MQFAFYLWVLFYISFVKKSIMRDPSMEQTALGISTTHGISGDLMITKVDRELLRNLAKIVAELAAHPREAEKKKLWIKLNDLKPVRPLVFCDPENGWNEIITQDQIKCSKPIFRVWEMALRKEIFWATQMNDDRVIEPFFNVPYSYSDTGWGLTETYTSGGNGGSHVWNAPLKDYEIDFEKLHTPEIIVDYKKTNEILNLANDIFGDILKVRLKGIWWWTLGMTMDYIHLRGLENLMMDMMLVPDKVHEMMAFLRDSKLKMLDFLESNKLLSLNTEGSYVGSGGFGWTSELPQKDFISEKVRTIDMWGFTESQETVGVSPEMFEEFVFPYQLPIMERFGLNCYGCCEPLDMRWHIIKKFPNLRRVSVSPWADRTKMAENLKNKYVLSLKPSPTALAMPIMDEEFVRAEIKKDLLITKGCQVEIIMKDNHTLGNNPMNAINWCRIAKEEAEK